MGVAAALTALALTAAACDAEVEVEVRCEGHDRDACRNLEGCGFALHHGCVMLCGWSVECPPEHACEIVGLDTYHDGAVLGYSPTAPACVPARS